MPYIDQQMRDMWMAPLETLLTWIHPNVSDGILNYLITRILLKTNPKSYADFNRLVGVLECAKMELYRRKIASYEDTKIQENGDVY